MSETREVVITGVGVVSPIGVGKEAFWSSLIEGRSGVIVRPEFANSPFAFRIGSQVGEFDEKQYIKPRKALKVMCHQIQMGNVAAMMAMEDARLAEGQYDPDRVGVVLGSELFHCAVTDLEAVYRHCLESGSFDYNVYAEHSTKDIYPLWMLKHLPNMPACHIGIALDARGHNNSILLDGASSLMAILEAVDVIERGWSDVMVAGGTGSQIELTTMIYHGELNMSRRIEDPQRASRPFDAGRDGMVIGEGAAALILERREFAEARGANILAQIVGRGRTFGLRAQGKGVAAIRGSIDQSLRSAGLEAADIGHVNAHGRSTVLDDAMEAQAIRESLGDVPVTAPKGHFGYLGAGGGAVEMIASVLALGHGEVPPTLNYEQPDPQCPVNVIHDEPLRTDKKTALVLNQSFSGQSAAVLLAGA